MHERTENYFRVKTQIELVQYFKSVFVGYQSTLITGGVTHVLYA